MTPSLVWYGMVWGEVASPLEIDLHLFRKTASLRCSTISLMHKVGPYGVARLRLVSYTHGHRDRSSTRPKVWFKFIAYSTSLLT